MTTGFEFGDVEYESDDVEQLDQDDIEQLDQKVNMATAFLLGIAMPRYRYLDLLLDVVKVCSPSLKAWSGAPVIWESVADLQGSVDRFKTQIVAFHQVERKFPCVTGIGERPIPIDPIAIPDYDVDVLTDESPPEIEMPTFDIDDLSIEEFAPGEVGEFFLSGLDGFLRTRLSVPSARYPYVHHSSSPGLVFQVTTDTSGHTVHCTHQYYFNPSYVFGSPTTPVNGYMQPGRWHFGTSTQRGPIKWDLPNVYSIPPTFQAHIPV